MRELVLDASIVLKWFATPPERASRPARHLLSEFRRGELVVLAPSLIHLEVLNVAGRSWGWPHDALVDLAAALDDLGFELVEPDLSAVAGWVAAGLTSYDAAYVALAEEAGVPLVTQDDLILEVAPAIAQSPQSMSDSSRS